uniref:Odorant receptor n=1 Tax=Meteorus pulchricornis TaxID=51522 RepID=A0A1S5VFL7_9HYME|nr:olfactory receptor 33 [Meteorus pulchricornis]
MSDVKGIRNHFSLQILRFFMHLVGMWPVKNMREQLISDILLFYIAMVVILALMIETLDFYYSWGDLHAISYNAPTTITVAIEVLKLTKFMVNRSEVMSFNAYTEKTFWKQTYSPEEYQILNKCNRQSLKIVATHIFLMMCVVWMNLSIAIVESVGKNMSDRTLPFNLYFNLPFAETPYYEAAFVFESAAAMGVGICTTSFAGFLCTTNLYAAAQFKILQRKIEMTCYNNATGIVRTEYSARNNSPSADWWTLNPVIGLDKTDQTNFAKDIGKNENFYLSRLEVANKKNITADNARFENKNKETFALLRDCIIQHQRLIHYMERVENLFSTIMLAQALGSILEICFSGFQILLGVGNSIMRTTLSVQFLIAAMVQLLLFSWSSHEIIIESQEIAEAAYRACWYGLEYTDEGKAFRQSLLIIIARARKPCILTVGKFAPMSLDTFTSVFNTSISYFTILRQVNEEGMEE